MMTEYTMYEAFRQAANKAPHDLAIYYEGKRINFKTRRYDRGYFI